jgi:acyl-CoA synthetase (AMP-forming)/AMP-acid ligase II
MSGIPLSNVPDVWNNVVAKFPNKTAVIFEGESHTFAELDDRIRRMSASLRERCGVRKGDRVSIAMPNCVEFYLTYWAAVHLGAVVSPVNIRLNAEGMRYVINTSESETILVHRSVWRAVAEALEDCPAIKHVVAAGFEGDEEAPADTIPFAELEAADPIDLPCASIDGDDLITLVYTSGTTGQPKGAVMTHDNELFNIKNNIVAHSCRHEDVNMLVVAMFHCTGLYSIVPTSAYLGSTVVIAQRPNMSELAQLIQDHRITSFIGVPSLLHFLTTMRDFDDYDLSSLRMIAYSGSPMPRQTITRLREKFPHVRLHNFFGLTETISITHVLPSEDALERAESIGKVLPDVGMKLIDEGGNEVASGEVGELCLRRENVVREYWRRPGLLEESMIDDWFRTGDLASVDDQGYVYLKGRKKDMIIVGGENVYALEVENTLLAHDDIRDAAVVGIEATGIATYLGELIRAVVVAEPDAELSERDVKRHCSERLATFKVPHQVEFRDELPRNPSGKVLKEELK